MGKPTYYNQKDRDLFHEGWFGQAGAAMLARKKDGSLTLGGIHKKQTAAVEPHATRSTIPEGKTPGATSTMAPGRTLLSRPTGQPAATPSPASAPVPIIPAVQTTPGTSTTPALGPRRHTLLSTGALGDVSGRGGGMAEQSVLVEQEAQPPESVEQKRPTHAMKSVSDASAMYIGEDGELGRGVGESIKKGFEVGDERFDAGDVQNQINNLYAEMAAGSLSSEKKAELAQWKAKLASIPGRSEDEGVLEGVLLDVAEGLGARKEDFKKHILGQDGSSRLTLDKDPASRVGDYLFSRIKSDFGGNFETFKDMTDPQGKPMDENAARAGAVLVTSAELALEMFGGKVLKAIPGADKAKKAILQRVVNAAMSNDKVRAMVIQGSKQLGEGVESVIVALSEGLTELVATEASKQVSNANGTQFEAARMEDVVNATESAPKEGTIGFLKNKGQQLLLKTFK